MKSVDLTKLKKKVLRTLDRETTRLEERLTQIKNMRSALDGVGGVSGINRQSSNGRKKKRHMSAAGRRAIARAQRLRWKKIKAEK